MPVVLRLERPPPARSAVLEAAAAAALAVCLDPRAAPGGEWHEPLALWVAGRIRKIARRARGAHWAAVQDLAGVTVTAGQAQVRALLPGPVDEVPRVVARLQIGGTDLEPDDPGPRARGRGHDLPQPGDRDDRRQGRRPGRPRIDAGGRACGASPRCPSFAVRAADRQGWARLCAAVERDAAVAVRDAGLTEVVPGTITCIAARP